MGPRHKNQPCGMPLELMRRCAGWARPPGAKLFHYFWKGESLCRRWHRPELAHPTKPLMADACVACWNSAYPWKAFKRSEAA